MLPNSTIGGDTFNNMVYDSGTQQWVAITRVDITSREIRESAASVSPAGMADAGFFSNNWTAARSVINNGLANKTHQVYGMRPFKAGHVWMAFVVL